MRITKVATKGPFFVTCEHEVAEYDGRDMYYVYRGHHLCGSLSCMQETGEYVDERNRTNVLGTSMMAWLNSIEEAV